MSLGEAFVTAQADTDGFLPDLKTKLDSVLRGFTQDVKVVADISAFRTQLEAATRAQAITVEVHADTVALRDELERATRDRALRVRVEFLGDDNRNIVVPVVGDLSYIKGQIAELNGLQKARPLRLYFEGEFEKLHAEINRLEEQGLHMNVRPKNLRSFRKLVNDGLAKLPPIDVRLASRQFRSSFSETTPTAGDEDLGRPGREGAAGYLEMSAAADKATASIRQQLRALLAAGATEREALSLLRRELDELAARARALRIDIPVDIDTVRLAAALERAVARAEAAKGAVEVPIKADLTQLRAQLANLGDADAIEVPVRANLTFLRAQLAALAGLGARAAIPVPVSLNTTSLASMRAQMQAYFTANPVEVDIQARLEPGNLRQLRTQAGRLASVTVKTDIDPVQFRTMLATAASRGVDVKIQPTGVVQFRAAIEAITKTTPAWVHIRVANIVQFREEIATLTARTKARVNIEVGNIAEFRAAIAASLTGAAALGVNLKVGNPGPFRAEVRNLLDREYLINIRPVISPADQRRLNDQARRAGDSAGRTLADRLNKAFSFAFGSLGRNFRSLERSFLALAGVGEAAFVGIGAAGVKLASDLELVQISIANIARGTQRAAEEGRLAFGDTLLGFDIKADSREFQDELDALQGRIKQFAIDSPLGFNAVTDSVIRLTSSLDVTGDQALRQIEAITGALAISPQGLTTEGLDGVVTALTQIAAAGKLGGQELLQLSNRLPALSRPEIFLNLAKQLIGTRLAIKGVTDEQNKLTAAQLKQIKALQRAGDIDSNFALQAIFETLEQAPGAADALEEFTNSFQGTVQRIKETLALNIGTAFLPILDEVGDALDDVATKIGRIFRSSQGEKFVEDFGRQVQVVAGILVEALPGVLRAINSIGNAFTNIFSEIGPDGFAQIGETIAAVFDNVAAAVGPTVDFIRRAIEIIAPIVSGIIGAIREAAPAFQPFIESVVRLAVAFGGFLKDVGGPVLQILGKALSSLAPVIDLIAGALKIVGTVLGAILSNSIVQKIASFVLSFVLVGAAIGKVTSALKTAGLAIGGFIARAIAPFRALLVFFANLALRLGGLSGILGSIGIVLLRLGAVVSRVFGSFRNFVVVVLGKAVVVVGALAAAFDSVASAIRNGFVRAIDFVLAGMQQLFELAGNLPFIGDQFDGLAAKVAGVRDQLNAIPAVVDSQIRITVTVDSVFAPGFGQGSAQEAAAEANAAKLGNIKKFGGTGLNNKAFQDSVKSSFGSLAGGGFGLDPGDPGSGASKDAKAAADEAQRIADKFLEDIKDILKGLNAALLRELTGPDATAESISQKFRDIANGLADAFAEAGKARPDALINLIRRSNRELQRLVNERNAAAEKLKDVQERTRQILSSVSITGIDSAKEQAAVEEIRTIQLDTSKIILDGGKKTAAALRQVSSVVGVANSRLKALIAEGTGNASATTADLFGVDGQQLIQQSTAAANQILVGAQKITSAVAEANRLLKLKIAEGVGNAFATTLGTQIDTGLTGIGLTFKESLEKNLQALREFQANVEKLAAAGLDKGLLAQIVADQNTELAASLSTANAQSIAQINETARQAALASKAITDATTVRTEEQKKSAADFKLGLQQNLNDLKAFNAQIAELAAAGLNQQTLDDLLQAGLSAKDQVAALAADPTQIARINQLQKALTAQAEQLALAQNESAEELGLGIGGALVDGLIKGLEDKQDALNTAARRMVASLEVAIRRAAGIASPSKLFAKLAGFMGDGVVVGLSKSIAPIADQAKAITKAATPSFSTPSIGQLSQQADAQSLAALRSQQETSASGTNLSPQAVSELRGIMQMARSQTVIQAPVTVHTPAPAAAVQSQFRGFMGGR